MSFLTEHVLSLLHLMVRTKSPQEIKTLREGGKRLAHILRELQEMIAPGVETVELEEKARKLVSKLGDKPAGGFTAVPCVLMRLLK